MSKRSFTNREFFEQEHPQEYAALLNMVQRGSSIYDCQVRLTEKKVIVETESFTNIEKMKKYKLDYAPGVANELEALYDRLANQKRTMYYPYYSWLVQVVDSHLKDKGITLIITEGPAILKDAKNDQEEVYRFNREDYEKCLGRVCELIADTSKSTKNDDLISHIWEAMSKRERQNVLDKLSTEDQATLKSILTEND